MALTTTRMGCTTYIWNSWLLIPCAYHLTAYPGQGIHWPAVTGECKATASLPASLSMLSLLSSSERTAGRSSESPQSLYRYSYMENKYLQFMEDWMRGICHSHLSRMMGFWITSPAYRTDFGGLHQALSCPEDLFVSSTKLRWATLMSRTQQRTPEFYILILQLRNVY